MNTFMYKVKSQGYALALMSAEQVLSTLFG